LKNICIAEGYEFSEELVSDIPKRWEKHGDLVLFSAASFNHTVWLAMGEFINNEKPMQTCGFVWILAYRSENSLGFINIFLCFGHLLIVFSVL